MIHARDDYNRIQDPAGKIGEDEPVFMVRAKDELAPRIMEYWATLWEASGDNLEHTEMADMVRDHAKKAREWQKIHGCKRADL